MYAWKWWRENRGRIIAYVILLVTTSVFFAWVSSADYRNASYGNHTVQPEQVWQTTLTVGLAGFSSILMGFIGLGLGASGVGDEFAQNTLEFLLTRPRPRKYFVWVGWSAGLLGLLMIVVLAVLSSFLTLTIITKAVHNWRFLVTAVPLFVVGAVVYSLTYFMTAVGKSGRAGLSSSLGLLLVVLLLPTAAHALWRIDLPSLTDVLEAARWATVPGAPFPVSATVGWSLATLMFPLATQLLIERAEL